MGRDLRDRIEWVGRKMISNLEELFSRDQWISQQMRELIWNNSTQASGH